MPRISSFQGITIKMYWHEPHHSVGRFHAEYGEHEASFDLTGGPIAGMLPVRQMQLVQAWAELHGDELRANWKLAVQEKPLIPIDPLR